MYTQIQEFSNPMVGTFRAMLWEGHGGRALEVKTGNEQPGMAATLSNVDMQLHTFHWYTCLCTRRILGEQ